MHLEDNALSGSGICCLSGTSDGPFVATDWQVDPRNFVQGRLHVNAIVARELGEAAGCVRPETHAQTLGTLAEAHARIAELEGEVAVAKAEADALMVLVGAKLGARANHIRKEAGFKARQQFDKQRDYLNGEIEAEEANLIPEDELATA